MNLKAIFLPIFHQLNKFFKHYHLFKYILMAYEVTKIKNAFIF